MSVEAQRPEDKGSDDKAAARPGLIRPYAPRDRQAVRDICCQTAYRNRGAKAVCGDEDLFADYWTLYYTDYEPESAWVAEENGRVVAYLLGCVETRRFRRIANRRIMPRILAKALWRGALGRYKNKPFRRLFRWIALKSWREAADVPIEQYPAHYHCNVVRPEHSKNYYTRLALTFMDCLEARGCTALHGKTLEPKTGSVFERIRRGFTKDNPGWIQYFSEKPTDFYRDVLGEDKEMMNRAFCFRLADYRRFLQWAAARHHV